MTHVLPQASVVVTTRDRPQLAADAVRSVLAGELGAAEVIVIDQSERPAPALEALATEHPSVRYLAVEERGLSRARNLGAREARSEIVAFIDDDELAEPGWLAAHVDTLARAGTGIVSTGRVLPGEPEVGDAVVPATVLEAEPAQFRGRLERDVLAGGNMAAWRSTLLDLGGFDPRLGAGTRWPSAEDNDLGLRLLESGHTIAYVPAALVRHRAWRAGASYPGVRWRYGRGKGGFYAKHARLDGAYGLRRASRDVGRRLVRGVVSIMRPRYAAGELMYAAGVIVGMVGWTVRRPKA